MQVSNEEESLDNSYRTIRGVFTQSSDLEHHGCREGWFLVIVLRNYK